MDTIVCTGCGAEPGDPTLTPQLLELEGWDFTGEHGERCPECLVLNAVPPGVAGLDAIAEALGASKKETT